MTPVARACAVYCPKPPMQSRRVAFSSIDFPKMRLCPIFLLIISVFADEYIIYSKIDHLNASDILQHADCPPLFYGQNCQIPHCFPEHGHLARIGLDDYYCNCTRGAFGKHCEKLICLDGKMSNSTFKCECPYYAWGTHCHITILKIAVTLLVIAGLLLLAAAASLGIIYFHDERQKKKSQARSTNRNQQNRNRRNQSQLHPGPEVLIALDILST
uniref:EGF-like domain-containing protein n=1 Tax=Panagrellus redivivus TaxID=6233 RepID=A0A7E4VAY5_PANRE